MTRCDVSLSGPFLPRGAGCGPKHHHRAHPHATRVDSARNGVSRGGRVPARGGGGIAQARRSPRTRNPVHFCGCVSCPCLLMVIASRCLSVHLCTHIHARAHTHTHTHTHTHFRAPSQSCTLTCTNLCASSRDAQLHARRAVRRGCSWDASRVPLHECCRVVHHCRCRCRH